MGRCGTESPPSPAGVSCLEVTCLISPTFQARTSTGLNIRLVLTSITIFRVPFHIKANQISERPTLFSSVHMGTLAQA